MDNYSDVGGINLTTICLCWGRNRDLDDIFGPNHNLKLFVSNLHHQHRCSHSEYDLTHWWSLLSDKSAVQWILYMSTLENIYPPQQYHHMLVLYNEPLFHKQSYCKVLHSHIYLNHEINDQHSKKYFNLGQDLAWLWIKVVLHILQVVVCYKVCNQQGDGVTVSHPYNNDTALWLHCESTLSYRKTLWNDQNGAKEKLFHLSKIHMEVEQVSENISYQSRRSFF